MAQIELELIGGEIAISLEGGDEHLSKTRRITAKDALSLSILLMCDAAAERPVNLSVRNGVSVQIESSPYDRAWLGIDNPDGPDLVACLEEATIRAAGRYLNSLYLTAIGSSSMPTTQHILPISYCYLDDPESQEDGLL